MFCGRAERDVCLFDGVHVLNLTNTLGPAGCPGAAWQLHDKFEGDSGECLGWGRVLAMGTCRVLAIGAPGV